MQKGPVSGPFCLSPPVALADLYDVHRAAAGGKLDAGIPVPHREPRFAVLFRAEIHARDVHRDAAAAGVDLEGRGNGFRQSQLDATAARLHEIGAATHAHHLERDAAAARVDGDAVGTDVGGVHAAAARFHAEFL